MPAVTVVAAAVTGTASHGAVACCTLPMALFAGSLRAQDRCLCCVVVHVGCVACVSCFAHWYVSWQVPGRDGGMCIGKGWTATGGEAGQCQGTCCTPGGSWQEPYADRACADTRDSHFKGYFFVFTPANARSDIQYVTVSGSPHLARRQELEAGRRDNLSVSPRNQHSAST